MKLRERTLQLVNESAKGNAEPVWKAFSSPGGPGSGMALEAVRAREAEFWSGFRKDSGELRGVQTLAVFPARPGVIGVLLRLEGSKGTSYLQYGWEDGQLVGIRPIPSLPGARFVAVKGGGFARLDFRSGEVATFRFDGDSLVLPIGGQERRATRK